ncbi:MAG: 50S ribosomal protein P1 [Candidatus Heimdallarchaeota archaeon]|nr:50S ribosomal protein P1 [Candidatus Heimdallarchaeota archaeon]MDH5644618.1 50S ribosomal protein P1 [Candidatus Heimdallarchaeota archaeon]
MYYLYSALLLHKAEKEITEDAITKILKAAGVDADKSRVKALVAALADVDIEEALATAAMAAPVAVAPVSGGGSETAAAPVEEEDEEEGEEVEDDDEGLGSLFG